MNGFSENVRPIVDSIVYREKAGQWPNALRGQFPFVTISRQSGAGGHTLALAVMEELKKEFEGGWSQGWQVMDQEICRQVAEDPAVRVPVDSLLAAEYHSELEDILKELFLGYCSQDAVIRRMLHLIRDSATFGKVILVGRGASCLTRDLPMGVHIRLVASLESRLRRMRQSMNINEKQAREMIHDQDKAREKLVKIYFGKNIEDPLLYDAVWNTDTVPMETLAGLTVSMIREKAIHAMPQEAAETQDYWC